MRFRLVRSRKWSKRSPNCSLIDLTAIDGVMQLLLDSGVPPISHDKKEQNDVVNSSNASLSKKIK
jgi:hypothetical protein